MHQQDVFASTQILAFNPILKENAEIRTQYFLYLIKLIRLVKWDKRKYTKAQIAFYRENLCGESHIFQTSKDTKLPIRMCYLIPYDLVLMLAFRKKVIRTPKISTIINMIARDFDLPPESVAFLYREIDAALGDNDAWHEVFANKAVNGYKRYLKIVKENIFFIRKHPYNILITATMSSGKSTLINTLVGKNICRMQNMACTSKIHTIISKPFEDGATSEYDHDLLMDATKEELFTNNGENLSYKITVGTYFNSNLGGQRIILFDSPGVNSSENVEHREISYKMLRSKKYDLLLYVMNTTQLRTDDDAFHLSVVKSQLGRAKILFVINQIDNINFEEENYLHMIENQRDFLISKGFRDPIICPVSARAAYIAKKSQQENLGLVEQFELQNFIGKFERNSMSDYYEKYLHCPILTNTENKVSTLLKNCGFAYLETIIEHLNNGGKINGSGIC